LSYAGPSQLSASQKSVAALQSLLAATQTSPIQLCLPLTFTADDFAKWNQTSSSFRIPKKLIAKESLSQLRVSLIRAFGDDKVSAVQALPSAVTKKWSLLSQILSSAVVSTQQHPPLVASPAVITSNRFSVLEDEATEPAALETISSAVATEYKPSLSSGFSCCIHLQPFFGR
jgi:hypothetical protein